MRPYILSFRWNEQLVISYLFHAQPEPALVQLELYSVQTPLYTQARKRNKAVCEKWWQACTAACPTEMSTRGFLTRRWRRGSRSAKSRRRLGEQLHVVDRGPLSYPSLRVLWSGICPQVKLVGLAGNDISR